MHDYFVEGDNEWRLPLLEDVDGFDGLGFESVHDVDNQDGNVAQGGAPRSQVAKETNTTL